MLSRKETYRKKKNSVSVKLLIAFVSVLTILGGTLTVSFANEDLDAMLTNWFDEKRMDAIVNIKTAVSSEKELQKERLRDEMQKEMAAAETELNQITAAEKERRIQNLRDYTDKLIAEIEIDNSAEKQQMKNQLESIYTDAKKALDTANANWKSSVAAAKVEEPKPTDKPGDIAEPAEPAEPKAEEPVASPETPVQPPPADDGPPGGEQPPSSEESGEAGSAEEDGQ